MMRRDTESSSTPNCTGRAQVHWGALLQSPAHPWMRPCTHRAARVRIQQRRGHVERGEEDGPQRAQGDGAPYHVVALVLARWDLQQKYRSSNTSACS